VRYSLFGFDVGRALFVDFRLNFTNGLFNPKNSIVVDILLMILGNMKNYFASSFPTFV
jgi:hypothetical protein